MEENYIEIQADENTVGIDDVQYKNFRATYKIITFAMGIGLIYPNPEGDRRKMMCILLTLLTVTPVSCMIFLDMYNSWLRRDIINVIRHCTVVGPFLGGFSKMFIMFYKRVPSKLIIDEINNDYASYNHLPLPYKVIVNASVHNSLVYSEKCWAITVFTCVMTFPFMAIVMNTYSYLFKDEPVKYMVHDMNKPFSNPESRFESPFFEIMFVYMIYCSVLYVVNFTGYDGFFGLCINHACLKIELYCKAFEEAMTAGSKADMHQKLVGVIKEQNKMFEFVQLIQETFNIWLGIILIATMIQICNCMYHITEGYELDLRYIIFILGTVVHIYLPCRYSAKLKDVSLLTSTLLYCGGWEANAIRDAGLGRAVQLMIARGQVPNEITAFNMMVFHMDDKSLLTSTLLYCGGWEANAIRDAGLGRAVQLMIARGQVPNEITAFNMMVFDMELFVSILQTSYSMYTLLRS